MSGQNPFADQWGRSQRNSTSAAVAVAVAGQASDLYSRYAQLLDQQQQQQQQQQLLSQSNKGGSIFQQTGVASLLQHRNHAGNHLHRYSDDATSLLSASVQSQLASTIRNQVVLPPIRDSAVAAAAASLTGNPAFATLQHSNNNSNNGNVASAFAALQHHHRSTSMTANTPNATTATATTPVNQLSLLGQATAASFAPSAGTGSTSLPTIASRGLMSAAAAGLVHSSQLMHHNHQLQPPPQLRQPPIQTQEPNPQEMKMPCQARGMPADHNSSTAYFIVPVTAHHGQHLVCSFPACKAAGIKFRLCKFCTKPVTKQNFKSRHHHPEMAARLPPSNNNNKNEPEDASSKQAGKKRKAAPFSADTSELICIATRQDYDDNASSSDSSSSSPPQSSASTSSSTVHIDHITNSGSNNAAINQNASSVNRDDAAAGFQRLEALASTLINSIGRRQRWAALPNERPDDMRQFGQWIQSVVDVSDPSIPWDSVHNLAVNHQKMDRWASLLDSRPKEGEDMDDWLTQILQASKKTALDAHATNTKKSRTNQPQEHPMPQQRRGSSDVPFEVSIRPTSS